MKIKDDHRLYHDDDTPYDFRPSPNFDRGLQPTYLMMHYTAGTTAEGAIQWLCNPQKENPDIRVSAHLVISRTGEITQLVPFNCIAYHAGFSYWEGKKSLNRFSIGIEMDNDGFLTPKEDRWISKPGALYDSAQVKVATHWKLFKESGWLVYPEVQYQAALEVARVLVEKYGLIDVLGHEDVHPAKVDPGPAFPLEQFRQELFGRVQPLLQPFTVRRTVRIYQDVDGTQPRLPPRLAVSPLPRGTPVKVLKNVTAVKIITLEKPAKQQAKPGKLGKPGKPGKPAKPPKKAELKKNQGKKVQKLEDAWSLVRVLAPINGVANLQGWVKSNEVASNATAEQVEIYKDIGAVPDVEPPLHSVRFLPEGTQVRLLDTQGNWALVGLINPLPRFKYLQGWVYRDELEQIQA